MSASDLKGRAMVAEMVLRSTGIREEEGSEVGGE